jgi:hypothetical protein
MFRNLNIRNIKQVQSYYSGDIPFIIINMIKRQSQLPVNILRIGILSKSLMLVNYIGSLFSKK